MNDDEKIQQLRSTLMTLLDTAGAELVGACLPAEIIDLAKRTLEATKNG